MPSMSVKRRQIRLDTERCVCSQTPHPHPQSWSSKRYSKRYSAGWAGSTRRNVAVSHGTGYRVARFLRRLSLDEHAKDNQRYSTRNDSGDRFGFDFCFIALAPLIDFYFSMRACVCVCLSISVTEFALPSFTEFCTSSNEKIELKRKPMEFVVIDFLYRAFV